MCDCNCKEHKSDDNSRQILPHKVLGAFGAHSPYFASDFRITSQITLTASGAQNVYSDIAIPDGKFPNIGQYPSIPLRAHIAINSFIITGQPMGGSNAQISGILVYRDVSGNEHVLAADGNSAYTQLLVFANNTNRANITSPIISGGVITDARPPNLGSFGAVISSIGYGTATSFVYTLYANLAYIYEVAEQ